MKKKITITKDYLNSVVKEVLKENLGEGLSDNMGEQINKRELALYCLSGNEFLFAAKDVFSHGLKLRAANTNDLQETIAGEILLSESLEVSHDIDSMIEGKVEEGAIVIKVTLKNEKYYVVWER